MNIHHLELFYYVAKHGGISDAVRNIPYGIQQPAVSGQILQLEDYLGVTLFTRRPFSLTPEGEKLYRFIESFFSGIDAVAVELQGGTLQQIRIGASEIVLRDHLPQIIHRVSERFPQLKLVLREGYQPELELALQKQEIDLAVTLMDKKISAGMHARLLLDMPMILLVHKNSRYKSAGDLWKRDRLDDRLICLSRGEKICRQFQERLGQLGVDWFASIEVSTIGLLETFVANGFGIGLSVQIPKRKLHPDVRVLPLPGFPSVELGALWRGKLSPLGKALLEELETGARLLME
jgi:DNA-binding transcriptional LysR family regulator